MINQLKLSLLFNRYNWIYLILFIFTIAFDIFLLITKEIYAYSPYSTALYVLLMYVFLFDKYQLRYQNLKELYYVNPDYKYYFIKNEWIKIILFNIFSYLLWSIEIILVDETILIVPLLYLFSISIFSNALLIMMYYFNRNIGYRIAQALIIPFFYIGNFLIFYPIKNLYYKYDYFANELVVTFWPIVSISVSLLISTLMVIFTIKYSIGKNLIWHDGR